MLTVEITNAMKDDHDNEDSDSDSSYSRKLHNLVWGKKDGHSSDENGFSDDEAARSWNILLNNDAI
jgi:hypothetical protein